MAKILGTFESRTEAQRAANQLVTVGVDARSLSIAGSDADVLGVSKTSLLWGTALGAGIAMLSPQGGMLYLIGHHASTAVLAFLGATVKGMLIGAATGSVIDFLLGLGERRRSLTFATEGEASGRFALTLDSNWIGFQRARAIMEAEHPGIDPSLIELVFRYGYEHQSFVSLYGEHEVWRNVRPEAAVIYRRVGRLVVVGGAPLASGEDLREATDRFLEFCRAQNLDCVMTPIGSEAAEIARQCGMGLLKIGESGYFKLPGWKPAGDRGKKVRAGVNQARKAGIVVERYDPRTNPDCDLKTEIETLCQRWLDSREVEPLGWLLELDPFLLSEHKRYFLARKKGGRLEAMLACCPIPLRKGWYLEDLIRLPDADRGVSELLVAEALDALASEGAELATLATSPLAGVGEAGDFKIIAWMLNLIYQHLDAFYHFKALHRFKSKFAPSFIDSEFAAIYPPRIRLRLILGLIRTLDPGGIPSLLASKLRRLRRERP
jgi:hypothetical protein